MKEKIRPYKSFEIEELLYERFFNFAVRHADDKHALEKNLSMMKEICSLLNGDNIDFPPFDLYPCPGENHKKFCKDENENWYNKNIKIQLNRTNFEYYLKNKMKGYSNESI